MANYVQNNMFEKRANELKRDQHEPAHFIHHYPILKNIMDNLDFQDLLACRKVCLSWKTVADPLLQTKGKVVIVGDDNLMKLSKVLGKVSPGNFPLSTIVLKRVSFHDGFNFGLHSSFIKSLSLCECNWNDDIMITLCSQLPQLNSLCLSAEAGHFQSNPSSFIHNKSSLLLGHKYNFTNLTNLHIRGDHGSNIIAVLLLLRNSPNLKIFTYKKAPCSNSDIYGNWLQNKLFSCDFVKNLHCLELDAPFYNQNFEKLREATFLKKLSININNGMVDDFMRAIFHLKHLKCLEVGIIDKLILPGSNILKKISDLCPNLEKVAIHSPSYPRITLVSVACFMLEEMQLYL